MVSDASGGFSCPSSKDVREPDMGLTRQPVWVLMCIESIASATGMFENLEYADYTNSAVSGEFQGHSFVLPQVSQCQHNHRHRPKQKLKRSPIRSILSRRQGAKLPGIAGLCFREGLLCFGFKLAVWLLEPSRWTYRCPGL